MVTISSRTQTPFEQFSGSLKDISFSLIKYRKVADVGTSLTITNYRTGRPFPVTVCQAAVRLIHSSSSQRDGSISSSLDLFSVLVSVSVTGLELSLQRDASICHRLSSETERDPHCRLFSTPRGLCSAGVTKSFKPQSGRRFVCFTCSLWERREGEIRPWWK